MAQSVRTGQVTPADELRDLLSLSEKRLANVRGGGSQAALDLLLDLDRIAVLWPELESQGVDLRPEAGRWATVEKTVYQKASRLLAELKPLGGIEKLRAEHHPEGTDAPWWRIDAYVREHNRLRTRRFVLIGIVVVVAGISLYYILRLLFPVDPKVQESVRRIGSGEQLAQQKGDFAAALAEFEAAAQATPDEADVWLRVGAAREQLGDAKGAQEAFDRARSLSASQLDFLRAQGSAYLALNLIDPADRALQAALKVKYDDAQSWYLLASVFESRRQISEAIDALGKAGQYAEETQQNELTAMARYRMGMLMQQQQLSPPTMEPAQTPAP
jgi:cytochrome c-type biogenesis protein CcmH/NrfG